MSIFTSFRRWWNNEDELDRLSETIRAQAIITRRTNFLIHQAPMLNAPTDVLAAALSMGAPTAFAYVHPVTFSKFYRGSFGLPAIIGRTKWIPTTLMPEGTVIYSPNEMPV